MAADSTLDDVNDLFGSDDEDDGAVVNAAGNVASSSVDKQRQEVDAMFGGSGSDSDSSAAAPKQKLTLKVKKKARKEGQRKRSSKQGSSGGAQAPSASAALSSAADGDAYDSEPEDTVTAADRDFIDPTGDDPALLAEYNAQQAAFRDERPPEAMEDNGEEDAAQRLIDEKLGGKGKRKRRREPTEEERHAAARDIITRMLTASLQDAEARKAGRPALHRMALLPAVRGACHTAGLAEILLDGPREEHGMGGTTPLLVAMRDWLKPSLAKDGKRMLLPARRVREECYALMGDLPVRQEHLRSSRMGQVLMGFWRHSDETAENKALLRGIIEKWMRPLVAKQASFKGAGRALIKAEADAMAAMRQHKLPRRRVAAAGEEEGGAPAVSAIEAFEKAAAAARFKQASGLRDALGGSAVDAGTSSSTYHAYVPKAMNLSFVRPPSSVMATADRLSAAGPAPRADEAMEVSDRPMRGAAGPAADKDTFRKRLARLRKANKAGTRRGAKMSIEGRGL